jgi:hypothetical protein
MAETEHKSFFRTHKVLAFLPLLLMGGAVLYYVQKRMAPEPAAQARPAAQTGQAGPAAPAEPKAPPPLPEVYDPSVSLDIQGSDEFKSQVTHALKLIWMSDRDTFLFIKKNLSVIRNEDKTGFYFDASGRPVAALSNDHAFRSLTWCAGVIAHQARHGWYKMSFRKKPSRVAPPPPGETRKDDRAVNPMLLDYKGLDAILYTEDKAFGFQLDVLRKVGAPKAEINLVVRRAPRDFSAAHDGSYTLNP